jgi:regulator of sigma E protease
MLGSILIFLIVLSILVLVHEFGHFWVARRNGIWVEEFGFGLPPRIFGKKVGETIYSINLFPFGGFVRLHGEQEEEGITNPKRAFLTKSKKVRSLVVVAGVIMNFILAVTAFAIVYSFSGIPRDTGEVKVVDVVAGSPAQSGGVVVGDIVKKVDGMEIKTIDDFIGQVEKKKGGKTYIELDNGKRLIVSPRENPPEGEGPLGVVISTTEIYFPPVWQRPFLGIYYGFKDAIFWGRTVLEGFASIFTNLFKGVVPKDVAGPVGIFAVTSEAAKIGILALVNFVGILSVNLAILNIIPFPALDGGRLLFIGIEGLIGKKVIPKVEAAIHTVGMIFLLILLLAITANDVRRLIAAGSISGFIDSIVK